MLLFFLLLLACVLIGLYAETRRTQIIGFVSVGFLAVLLIGYLVFHEQQPLPPQVPQGAPANPVGGAPSGKFEQSLTALKPSDIAVINRRLEPGVETYTGNDGLQHQRANLYSWTLSGTVKNLSASFPLKDLTLRVRLFSCPSYFTTPNEAVQSDDVELKCTTNGERTVGLYNLKLAPGAEQAFSQPITFIDQRDPVNWRYTVDVDRAVADVK